MFNTKQISRDFSDAAAQYDAHAHLQQHVQNTLLTKIQPLLTAQSRVLDAGCGTGQLARSLKNHSVTQLDIAYAMCKKAMLPGRPAINAAIESLPFADATFDVVFSSLALQWVADQEFAIKEMKRVCKPGAIVAFSTFAKGTLCELQESFAVVDAYPHVSSFVSYLGVNSKPLVPLSSSCDLIAGSQVKRGVALDPVVKPQDDVMKETITEYFPNLISLMRHLKAMGARNKHADRRRGMLTPRQMQKVEDYYREHFGTSQGLAVTWNVVYKVMHRL